MTIRAARMSKELSQHQAAELLGVSEATLRRYETGYSMPDVYVIKRMEKVYEISFAEMEFPGVAS